MRAASLPLALLALAAAPASARLVADAKDASRSWGELSVYEDNAEDAFGVGFVGLPDGCQVESVSTLQRHAERFPDSVDNVTTGGFAQRVIDFRGRGGGEGFTGPLRFLNSYRYVLDGTGLLTGRGALTEFGRGVAFWNDYGRTLFRAAPAQLRYSDRLPPPHPGGAAGNGTGRRPRMTLRTTGQSRIQNSQINWALGFFGPSFNATPDPALRRWEAPFRVVVIPEGGAENNTLAAYDSCANDKAAANAAVAGRRTAAYRRVYARAAAARLRAYAPAGFRLTHDDVYAMQTLCAYEYAYLGQSDFCSLFTADEWAGFENVLDLQYYYSYGFGNPTGRAQGIGYVQELLARLTGRYIGTSDSSVNATLDGAAETFPLGQAVYADFSHDDIIVSVLTALSLDYFAAPPTLDEYPPPGPPGAHGAVSRLTPFGANLVTELVGCREADPAPVERRRVAYAPDQYGYDGGDGGGGDGAPHKFVRMRLNNGVLPLSAIRGGACGTATSGRVDGLCPLDAFVASQADAFRLSNYAYACFGNYTLPNTTAHVDFDGTIFADKTY